MHERFVVFDCDGVMLESNEAKTAGFATVFADHPEHVEAIVALHERHGGVSRYIKFDWIHRDILRLPLSEARSEELSRAYTEAVLEKVLASPEVPGLRPVLEDLQQRGVPAVVLSGTPQAELEHILRQRGLDHYFVEIIGSPTAKPAALRRLLASDLGHSDRTPLFVGDALCDQEAAVEAGLPFLGRVPEGTDDPFPASTVTMSDLRGYQAARDRLATALTAASSGGPS